MEGSAVIRYGALAVLILAGSVLAYLLVFRDGSSSTGPEFADLPPVTFPEEVAPVVVLAPELTHDAYELRRVAAEHARLLTSLPPTATPVREDDGAALQAEAARLAASHPDGAPLPTAALADWFDESRGLDFYREEGGDWTLRELRENHPYRELFYYDAYPEGVKHFADGSIYPLLARKLALEATQVLPELGAVSERMVTSFRRRLGWAIRDERWPVINVWTTFVVYDRGVESRYAVGGVLGLRTRSSADGEYEFLVPGEFVGVIPVQRIATRVGG